MLLSFPERYTRILVLIFTVALLIGCSGGTGRYSPTAASVTENRIAIETDSSNHILLGYWDAYIPESHDVMEIIPRRSNSIHLNIRKLLEDAPCQDCFQLVGLNIDQPNQILSADIRITHPFPGLDTYTVFDTHLVIISDGSLYFPALDATIPDIDSGDFTIINPDGFTRFWNTVEFGEGSGAFAILEYSQGKLAFPGDFTGTVNPYVAYGAEPRNHLGTTSAITRTVDFKLVPGSIRFGYAVDACWELPIVIPPENIETDFPLSANALEASLVGYEITNDLEDSPGSTGWIVFVVDDFQGVDTIESASLECPDLWSGALDASAIQVSTANEASIEFSITNENGMPVGDYSGLLIVKDVEDDFWLGDVNQSYSPVIIPVVEDVNPQITGDIVFTAPGPPDPGGFGTTNVWHMDLETGIETMLTNFFGVGYLFHEPRINPSGTHHLHCMGPTPYYSNVRVYEFGGSDWTITTDEVDDYADFHPDGIHIVCAGGDTWGDTPDLYMMEYDGSNRTKIATVPGSLSLANPAVSPDGKFIAMSVDNGTRLYLFDTESETWLDFMPYYGVDLNPAWTPVKVDGEYLLAFSSNRDNYPDSEKDIFIASPYFEWIIYKYDSGLDEEHPSFSPDGLSFIYYTLPDGESDTELFIFSWKTEELVQITDDDTWDGTPHWCWGW